MFVSGIPETGGCGTWEDQGFDARGVRGPTMFERFQKPTFRWVPSLLR